jgi:hypothetical protein
MLKTLDKCKKCFNSCKCATETNAQLLTCSTYLSKRSVKLQKERVKENVSSGKVRVL